MVNLVRVRVHRHHEGARIPDQVGSVEGTLEIGDGHGVAAARFGDEVVGEREHLPELARVHGGGSQVVDLLRRIVPADHRVRPGQGVLEELHFAAEGRGEDGDAPLRLEMGDEIVAEPHGLPPGQQAELGLELDGRVLKQLGDRNQAGHGRRQHRRGRDQPERAAQILQRPEGLPGADLLRAGGLAGHGRGSGCHAEAAGKCSRFQRRPSSSMARKFSSRT
jgi:hypothetical protein